MIWTTPWLLAGLIGLLPWLWWRQRTWVAHAAALPVLQHHPAPAAWPGLLVLLVLEVMLWGGAIAALAGPARVYELDLHDEAGIDLALVVDISASMQAADLPPNRLEVVKRLSQDLVRRRAGNRIGVYAFAGFCATQVPFTTDNAAVIDLLDGLSYRSITHDTKSGGTAIGDALLVASDDLARLAVAGRDQLIVLATDGESTGGVDPVLVARRLREQGVKLHVIGIGQETEVPVFVEGKPFITTAGTQLHTRLDDHQLREIARAADGSYDRADSTDALTRVFEHIAALSAEPLRLQDVRVERSLVPQLSLGLVLLLGLWLGFDGLWLRRPLR